MCVGHRWKGLLLCAIASFVHVSKQKLCQRREPADRGRWRDVLLVNASKESDISLTSPMNHNENVVNMNILKNK